LADLQSLTLPEPTQYIEGLVAAGTTIYGGKPKLGKSWFVLALAVTIAGDGIAFGRRERRVRPAPVLFLALEDAESRLQSRMRRISPPGGWPSQITVAHHWPTIGQGAVELLESTVEDRRIGVVVIDTLQRIRGSRQTRDVYGEDYEALARLQDLTRRRPDLALIVVHHNRKADHPDDYIDALSGSTGITGAVDHIAVLTRGRNAADAVLHYTSRDLPEGDTAYSFDAGIWTELGPAATYELSQARRQVLDELKRAGEASLTEISTMVGKTTPTVLSLLRGLADEGLVHQPEARGPWVFGKPPNTANKPRSPGQKGVSN
jgi:hypothetical protein